MKASNNFILPILFYLLLPGSGMAQCFWENDVPQENFWEGSVNAGAAVYQGDLVPSLMGSYKDAAPMGGITAAYYFRQGLGVRTSIVAGGLRGNDAQWGQPEWRRQRHFSFKTGFGEWSLLATYDCLAVLRDRNYHLKWGFLLMAGGGVVYTNPARDVSGLDTVAFSPDDPAVTGLKSDMDRTPAAWIGLAILGGGIRYNISPKTSLYAEVLLHHAFSDRLDGFQDAVASSRSDGYMTYSIGYSFRIR